MKTLEQNASITIVENKKVTCATCLISEKAGAELPEVVNCMLNPKPESKHISEFCANGMWLYNGEVIDFKAAFKKMYDRSGTTNKKDLSSI